MKHRMNAVLLGTVVSVLLVSRCWADDVPANMTGSIGDTETRQKQIQSESQAVVAQIDSILAEYKQHGMENRDDAKTLEAIRSVMLTMSVEDMKQVIAMLRQVRKAGNPDDALHQSAAVSAAQGKIVLQLKGLMQVYARQEQQYDLAARFEQMAKRQGTNLSDLLDANRTVNYSAREDAMHDILALQRTQQDQLCADVQSALAELAGLSASDDPSENDRMQKALAQANADKLADNVAMASTELGAGHIFQASAAEKASRDSLREIARLLLLPTDTLSRLEQSQKDLDQVIIDQTQLASETHDAVKQKPETAKAIDLERRQGNVLDDTDQVRKNLDAISPKVEAELNQAMAQMQIARTSLQQQQDAPAAAGEDAAVVQLLKAQADLAEQVNKIEKQQDNPASNLDKAKDLQAQIEALKAKQIALEKQTEQAADPKPRQEAQNQQVQLQLAAVDIQQQAADVAPNAAPDLEDAAKDMDNAAKKLAPAVNDEPAAIDQQKQAIAALDRALKAMDQTVAKLEQEQNAADAAEKLDKAIQETDSATQQLQDADAAMADLQHRQEQIAQQLKQMDGDPKLAPQALQQAQTAANQAANNLAQNQPAQAAQAMHQASQAMQDAQQAAKWNDPQPAQTGAGKPPAMPDLVKQEQKLEQEATALAQQAAAQLADADKQVGDITAGDKGDLPADAKQALQQARHDLLQAATQAEAGQHGQAQKSAQSASQAMGRAQASMAAAQGKPAPGMPGNKPGRLPGDKPGKTNENTVTKGKGDRKDVGQGTSSGGARNAVAAGGQFVGLPQRDRSALQQSRAEKYPQEYAPQIEQYLRNLADDQATK